MDDHAHAIAVLDLARRELGSASAEALRDPEALARIADRQQRGLALDDAVFSEVYTLARSRPFVVDEFIGALQRDLARPEGVSTLPDLIPFVDADDICQSVFGDLAGQLFELRFDSRRQFLSMLRTRLDWKLLEYVRWAKAGIRSEDKRVDIPLTSLDRDSGQAGPRTLAIQRERLEFVERTVDRLRERDRGLLAAYWSGRPMGEIAELCGLNLEAARKAVQRARERLWELLGPED
jgi:RNA polymerase sigma factor (sigma-70 family)